MKKRKGILGVILTFSLLLGLSGIATAAEMSGMDMGGMDKSATQTQPSGESGSVSTEQHKATAGMDSNKEHYRKLCPVWLLYNSFGLSRPYCA